MSVQDTDKRQRRRHDVGNEWCVKSSSRVRRWYTFGWKTTKSENVSSKKTQHVAAWAAGVETPPGLVGKGVPVGFRHEWQYGNADGIPPMPARRRRTLSLDLVPLERPWRLCARALLGRPCAPSASRPTIPRPTQPYAVWHCRHILQKKTKAGYVAICDVIVVVRACFFRVYVFFGLNSPYALPYLSYRRERVKKFVSEFETFISCILFQSIVIQRRAGIEPATTR